jgi:hypothetical protein
VAYVGSPFRHDIFVSYSHGAGPSGKSPLKQWSTAFVRALEEELRAHPDYRDTLAMFVDAHDRHEQSIDAMAPLTEQLEAQVGASSILLVLLSPDYQKSKWCGAERTWWAAQQAAVGLPADNRIAMVHIWPVPAEWPGGAWPRELADRDGKPLLGYPFHEGDGDTARPLGWTERDTAFGKDVRVALLKLSGALYYKLGQIKTDLARMRKEKEDTQRLAAQDGQTIYLHGREDEAKTWERTAVDLVEAGYIVVPGEPDPVGSEPARLTELRETRVETLSACDALVLVGRDGRALDADLVVVGKHDRQSARARSKRWLPCALLDTIGAEVATPMRRTTARMVQTDWLDATHDRVAPVVKNWLVQKASEAAR